MKITTVVCLSFISLFPLLAFALPLAIPQTIQFDALPPITYGDTAITLTATSTSGLPVSFSASPTSVCALDGSLYINGAGNCIITASQDGGGGYAPADPVLYTITVLPKGLTVSFTALNKQFDGTVSATIGTSSISSGIVTGDSVSVSGGSAAFLDSAVGVGKLVNGDSFILGGDDAHNYTVATVTPTTANITPVPDAPPIIIPIIVPVATSGSGGNGPIAGSLPNGSLFMGQVLGASTSTIVSSTTLGSVATSSPSCGALLTDYMRITKHNNPVQVKKLQTFLNQFMAATLTVNGIFDRVTEIAVMDFQKKYLENVLTPWHINEPTGYVFKTTLYRINQLSCPTLNAPFPTL